MHAAEALGHLKADLKRERKIKAELLAALQAALEEARERDEDLGSNCWPQVMAAIARAEGDSE